MVYEENCGSCFRPRIVKFCGVRNINVCHECCVNCEKRSKCDLRVWFYSLKPVIR